MHYLPGVWIGKRYSGKFQVISWDRNPDTQMQSVGKGKWQGECVGVWDSTQ